MKLYQFEWGIYPRRLHIYLKEKGIQGIDMAEIDVIGGENRETDYLTKNPAGTIPTLETDSGHFICQSSTILFYLEQQFPTPDMTGMSDEEKTRTLDQLALVNEAYHFAGICTYYGSPLFSQRREPSDEIAKAMRFEYERVLESLESLSGEGLYFGGDSPNIADVAFFASEQFMRELYKLQLPARLSRLESVYGRFGERPSATLVPYPEVMVPLAPIRSF